MDETEQSALEARLRRAAELFDPVPPHLADAALAAYSFRTLDAELARLTFDSLVEGAGAVRGDGPRLLTFTGDAVTVEVELTGDLLVGQLLPAGPAEIEVRSAARSATASADELGRFTASLPGRGPLRLHCRLASGPVVVTEWVSPR